MLPPMNSLRPPNTPTCAAGKTGQSSCRQGGGLATGGEKIKVNLHVLNGCNYHCRHCFAHFDTGRILPAADWKRIVDTCLESGQVDSFNLAGGEPLLYPELTELIDYIHAQHAECSVITNGSLLDLSWCQVNGPKLDVLGVSIDTMDVRMAKALGRTDGCNHVLDFSLLRQVFEALRQMNCRIKANTVVSDLNCEEKMSEGIRGLGVMRWKILKMKSFDTAAASNSGIGRNQDAFETFLKVNGLESAAERIAQEPRLSIIDEGRYPGMEVIIEPNLENGYLVVSPGGELCRNDTASGETVAVGNLLQDSFQNCLDQLPLNSELYHSRYSSQDAL